MYGLLILLGIVAIIIAYFCFGIAIKFLWGWFPVMFGVVVMIVSLFSSSLAWQVGGVLFFCISVHWTGLWHGSMVYANIEKKLNKLFNFED